jgi:predicted transport protein
VDYALKINRSPLLLVEAKSLNDPLTDVKDITQTTGYAANDGIVWCILTNGIRWRVYRSIEQCPAPEKLMYEVSYDPADLEGIGLQQVVEQFQRFSREQMAKGILDSLGEQTFTDGKVRKAIETLLRDPPKVFLKLVRNATGDKSLKPQTVRDSLGRVLSPLVTSPTGIRSTGEMKTKRRAAAIKAAATRRLTRDSAYSEESHTKDKPSEVLEIYRKLDQLCLGLRPNAIEKRFLAKYVAYRDGKRTFCTVHLQQGGLRVWLKLEFNKLPSPPSFARDVTGIGHWGVGDLELQITNSQQLSEATPLIRRSFEEQT